jgi:ATP-dependent DNA helicase DinG
MVQPTFDTSSGRILLIEIKADLLSVAETLKEEVYDNFSSVILTSATITVGQTFNFFDERCGTNLVENTKVEHKLLSSSFDYRKQVQFLVPEGITYSSGAEAQRLHYELSRNITEEGVIAAGGGALILCSSHKQVDSLYTDLVRPFAKSGLYLLRQTRGKSVGSVVREFAEDTNSVLVGTRSLWQGVDVPGPALRALFILKLPYLALGNPVMEARQEALDAAGKNGFSDYYEPLAVLSLKQGFGRLIRKATDKGVVVMMDDRILRKRAFTTSFPEGVEVKRVDRATILAALAALKP